MQKGSIDLHAHLGSMVNSRNLWKIAKMQGINLGINTCEEFDNVINKPSNKNHEEYLKRFDLTQKIQSSPAAVSESVYSAVELAYDGGLSGIEIRFNPMLRNKSGYYDLDSMIYSACHGLRRGIEAFGIKAGIIISTDRSFNTSKSSILAEKALKYKDFGIVGLDCSGSMENGKDITSFKKAYEIAIEGGINRTFHLGELEKYTNYNETKIAIQELKLNRIGHGIQFANDNSIIKLLLDNDVCLELCYTSNLRTKVVDSVKEFVEKLHVLHKAGVQYTINTDGNIFLNTNMKNEYKLLYLASELYRGAEFAEQVVSKSKINSLNYSFIK